MTTPNIAYHMAGHCVTAIHYKRSLISVSPMNPNPNAIGCVVGRSEDHKVDHDGFLAFIMEEFVISQSGPAAEFIFNGKTWTGTSDLCRKDVDFIYDIGTPLHKKGIISFDGFMDKASNIAFKLIKRPVVWAQIKALADAFMANETLTPNQIRHTCRDARRAFKNRENN
jgi:hypothetical protein